LASLGDLLVVAVREFLDVLHVREGALEGYRRTGYLVLTDLFQPSELAPMRVVWGQIADQRRREGKKPHATLLMTHVTHPEIASIVRHPLLVKTVEAVLGGKVDLIQSQLMHGIPGSKGFSPHQDNFYNRANPRDGIVAAWMALEDVDKENGALGVFPASHLNGLADTRRDWAYLLTRSPDVAKSLLRLASPKFRTGDDDSSVIERYVYAEAPSDIQPVAVALKAGSLVLMHGDAIHLSYPNQTKDRSRKSLLTNFVKVGTQFSAGKLSGRVPFDVYASAGSDQREPPRGSL
jgi:ectoine hydroxylase-related dioxygenase (phytanoyl-CoA dioxygenase family)